MTIQGKFYGATSFHYFTTYQHAVSSTNLTESKYIYVVEKEYIPKEEFNKLYSEYLLSINEEDIKEHFINLLVNKLNIEKVLLDNLISNDYARFFSENKDIVTSVISEDLNNFSEFLQEAYIYKKYDENDNYLGIDLRKEIKTNKMNIEYVFTILDREYSTASKYHLYSYKLDINYLWVQLEKLNLPKFYC